MQCGAKTRDEDPCKNHAVRGATRCRMHGGSSPHVRAHAAQVVQTERARRAAERHGITPVSNPLAELLTLAGEVRVVKDQLARKIDEGTPHALAYERALDRCHRVLESVARLGIEERLLRIEESQVRRFVEALTGTITSVVERLGHDPYDDNVRRVVIEELRNTQRALSGKPDTRRRTVGSISAGG